MIRELKALVSIKDRTISLILVKEKATNPERHRCGTCLESSRRLKRVMMKCPDLKSET